MHVMLHMRVIIPVLQGVAVSTATCVQLHKRAEKIAAALTEKGSINTGENVVLLYPPGGLRLISPVCVLVLQTGVFLTPLLSSIFFSGIDLIAAFYGCLYAGCVPVNVRPPHPQNLAATLPTVRMIIDVSVFFRSCSCSMAGSWVCVGTRMFIYSVIISVNIGLFKVVVYIQML